MTFDVMSLGAISTAWDELADEVGASPFLRPGWIAAWCRAFAPKRSLRLFTVHRGAELVAILPCLEIRSGLRSPTDGHSPHFDVLARCDGAAHQLLAGVLATRTRHLDLGPLRAVGAGSEILLGLAAEHGYATRVTALPSSPYIEPRGGHPQFEKVTSRSRRREVARCRRRLDEGGGLAIEVWDGSTDLVSVLEETFLVEEASWRSTTGGTVGGRSAERAFYADIARWAEERGWLRLTFLRVGSKAVAFAYDLEVGEVRYGLRTGYDLAHAKHGPGMVLHHDLVAQAFEDDLKSYELLGACDPWKLVWATGEREQSRVQLFSRSPLAVAERAGTAVAARARAAARQHLPRSAALRLLGFSQAVSDARSRLS